MPVQAYFLYHLVAASAVVNARDRIVENQEVEQHATEYVKAMEARDKEKEIGKVVRAVLVFVKRGAIDDALHPFAIHKFFDGGAAVGAHNEVCPLPSLAT